VADYRGWITREQAVGRARKILEAILDRPGWENIHGFFFHWVDAGTGRWKGAEAMCLHDHVALICGVLTVREYFKGDDVSSLADRIVKMSDWPFLMHRGRGTPSDRAGLLSNLSSYDNEDWNSVVEYDGMKLDYLLPIGATRGAVDPWYWDNWARTYCRQDYKGHYYRIARAALWIHQWDNCYLDLFAMRDPYADYFQNSVENTLANRQWCLDNNMYNVEAWGLNPTMGPDPKGGETYCDFGAPPAPTGSWQQGHTQDGTIALAAAVPSIIFTPGESLLVLRFMWDHLKDRMWGPYGFTASFNLARDWYSKDYLGIDLGPVVLNIENYRSGLIWKHFMQAPEVQRALHLTGFVGMIDNFDPMEHSAPYAEWSASRGVALSVLAAGALEGRRCLGVRLENPGREARLTIRPMRRDFSPYRLLGLYARVSADQAPFDVTLVDGRNREAALSPALPGPVLETGGWKLFAWSYDVAGDVDLGDIHAVVLAPRAEVFVGDMRLDYVCLYNEAAPGTARPVVPRTVEQP
jgi:hypothetical protein